MDLQLHRSQLTMWTSCGKIVILALLIYISFKMVLVKFSKKYISFLLFYQAYTYVKIKILIFISLLYVIFFFSLSHLYFISLLILAQRGKAITIRIANWYNRRILEHKAIRQKDKAIVTHNSQIHKLQTKVVA